ncbi:hypothetical protein M758_1G106200 [Ceratodon purpureus]|uniref:Uncharacterized protein n=1 Tax=Ceratodon purpureus TaxID=3225 RepID=A0A8T0J608_CERPU|nr:hypothetical protein KC19_1G118200 [Ceratodon purpureus]KAG0629466.1 hypothetical protein M758_1G106200 [Ceratodon purpureus]
MIFTRATISIPLWRLFVVLLVLNWLALESCGTAADHGFWVVDSGLGLAVVVVSRRQ